MEIRNMKNEPKKRSQVQEVIGLLLTKPEDECDDLQVEFPMECKTEPNSDPLTGSSVETLSIATSPPLNISHNAGMLLESGNVIHHSLDENSTAIQLEDGTTAFVQNLTAVDESDSCDATTKFIDGQAVQLEDGSTAFIHTAPREGLQPVQLEDGTMAYLSQTGADLFNGEASSLDLDQLSSTQIGGDNSDDKELDYKVTIVEATLAEGSTRALAMGEKAFRCPYDGCSRLYTTQHHLKVHERSHTGDRPFKCTECGKAFATGYGLKSHTRVHTGETPYRCASETCTKAFKTSGDLQKHVRTHTGERPFKCPFNGCDRAFTTSNIRKVHIRTHTGERPYICKEGGCGRAFASATNFKNHIRIHTGEKPYICTVQGCNRRFTEYSSLYKHNVVHTHSKPYICNLCGKNYRQTSTLAMHRRTVHGIVESSEDCSLNDTATEDETASIKQEPDCFPEVESFNEPEKKKGQGLELQSIDITHATNIVIQSANLQQDSVMSSALPSRKLPTIVTLQGNNSNQVLQEHPVYAVQLQPDGSLSSTQQIFVVTDPAQLAALQQFAQQAQLQNIIAQADGDAASK